MKHLFPDKELQKIIENPEVFVKYLIAYQGADKTKQLLDQFIDYFLKHSVFKNADPQE